MRPQFPRWPLAALVALIPLTFLAAALAAQQSVSPGLVEVTKPAFRRHGFWMTFGLGGGGAQDRLSSEPSFTPILYRPTADVRLGGTVNPYLRLGVEFAGWFNSEGDLFQSLGSALAVAQIYPVRTAGLFIKGGGGFAMNAVNVYNGCYYDCGYRVQDTGFAWNAGAGYEIPVGHSVFITPTFDVTWQYYSGRTYESYQTRVMNFGLTLGFQSQ